MQSLTEKMVNKAKSAERQVEEKLFSQWRKAGTVEEREDLHSQSKVLKALTNTMIHSIRGDKNG